MKYLLSVLSFLVMAAAFGFFMDRQEHIPIYLQVFITLVIVAYQILLCIYIFRRNINETT